MYSCVDANFHSKICKKNVQNGCCLPFRMFNISISCILMLIGTYQQYMANMSEPVFPTFSLETE